MPDPILARSPRGRGSLALSPPAVGNRGAQPTGGDLGESRAAQQATEKGRLSSSELPQLLPCAIA